MQLGLGPVVGHPGPCGIVAEDQPDALKGLIFGHNAAWARVTYYRAKTQLQKMLSSST